MSGLLKLGACNYIDFYIELYSSIFFLVIQYLLNSGDIIILLVLTGV